jgi:hypothetical protein
VPTFAKITDGLVEQVIVADQSFIEEIDGFWVQTSYNTRGGVHLNGGTPLRKNYAGVGMTYDAERDAFYAPQPWPSWNLNESTCYWEPPVPYPDDGGNYGWNEYDENWGPL